ncbi:MAG: hypothetical protein GX428_13120 [Candidatus Atribacteria bacterium]|nr:hypothetical protein [Candidatus Atribacteria bacterium]
MILGLLIIILILYGLVLFWVLNERLKSISLMIHKNQENLKKVEEKVFLLLSLTEEGGNTKTSVNVEDSFCFDAFEDQKNVSDPKGDK